MEAYKYIKRNVEDADSLILYDDGTLYVEMDGPEQCYEMKMKREDVLELYEAMVKLFSDTEPKTLTPEQAVVVSAFTGYHVGDFAKMHKAVEEKLGRPVWTHEFPSLKDEIREAFRDDFIAMNPPANDPVEAPRK